MNTCALLKSASIPVNMGENSVLLAESGALLDPEEGEVTHTHAIPMTPGTADELSARAFAMMPNMHTNDALRKTTSLAAKLMPVVLLVGVFAFFSKFYNTPMQGNHDSALELEAKVCSPPAYYNILKVVHNNFGGFGPGYGAEGITYEVLEVREDGSSRMVQLEAHALTVYKPKYNYLNGLSGGVAGDNFGQISEPYAHQIRVGFRFIDPDTGKSFRPKSVGISVFDLDTTHNGQVREYVMAHGPHSVHLSKDTTIKKTTAVSGGPAYVASIVGDASDDPVDPSKLTTLQKAKTITFTYDCPEQIEVTFGSTEGDAQGLEQRDHIFNFQPWFLTLPVDTSKEKKLKKKSKSALHDAVHNQVQTESVAKKEAALAKKAKIEAKKTEQDLAEAKAQAAKKADAAKEAATSNGETKEEMQNAKDEESKAKIALSKASTHLAEADKAAEAAEEQKKSAEHAIKVAASKAKAATSEGAKASEDIPKAEATKEAKNAKQAQDRAKKEAEVAKEMEKEAAAEQKEATEAAAEAVSEEKEASVAHEKSEAETKKAASWAKKVEAAAEAAKEADSKLKKASAAAKKAKHHKETKDQAHRKATSAFNEAHVLAAKKKAAFEQAKKEYEEAEKKDKDALVEEKKAAEELSAAVSHSKEAANLDEDAKKLANEKEAEARKKHAKAKKLAEEAAEAKKAYEAAAKAAKDQQETTKKAAGKAAATKTKAKHAFEKATKAAEAADEWAKKANAAKVKADDAEKAAKAANAHAKAAEEALKKAEDKEKALAKLKEKAEATQANAKKTHGSLAEKEAAAVEDYEKAHKDAEEKAKAQLAAKKEAEEAHKAAEAAKQKADEKAKEADAAAQKAKHSREQADAAETVAKDAAEELETAEAKENAVEKEAKKYKVIELKMKRNRNKELHHIPCGQGFQEGSKPTVCRDGRYDHSLAGGSTVKNIELDRDDAFAACSDECKENADCHAFEFSGVSNEHNKGNRCEIHVRRDVYVADMVSVSPQVFEEDADFICCLKN